MEHLVVFWYFSANKKEEPKNNYDQKDKYLALIPRGEYFSIHSFESPMFALFI